MINHFSCTCLYSTFLSLIAAPVDLNSVPGYHNVSKAEVRTASTSPFFNYNALLVTFSLQARELIMPFIATDGFYLLRPPQDSKGGGVIGTLCVRYVTVCLLCNKSA